MKPVILTAGLLLAAAAGVVQAQAIPDVQIMDTEVFPESITSTADGTLYIGSVKGNVYRAAAGADQAHPWIRHSQGNGILTILGVLADESRNALWLCSVPNMFGPERSEGISALKRFDLASGELTGSWDFPAPAAVCNDITLAADGTAYASDTSNGRIFSLAPGAAALAMFGADPSLVGIDGLAFSEDGTLYVNNVRSQEVIRVAINRDGSMGQLTSLALSHELGGPDGMRLIGGNRFIQAEGTVGRLGILEINGDIATLSVLRDDLLSTPGATVVGNTAYVLESNIGYLFNPELRGKEIPPFMVYAVPLK